MVPAQRDGNHQSNWSTLSSLSGRFGVFWTLQKTHLTFAASSSLIDLSSHKLTAQFTKSRLFIGLSIGPSSSNKFLGKLSRENCRSDVSKPNCRLIAKFSFILFSHCAVAVRFGSERWHTDVWEKGSKCRRIY